jgi:type IV pilus assembly protein PilC
MLDYNYTARDPATGRRVKATVQADNEQAAAKLIHEEGFVPLDISVAGSAAGANNSISKLLHRVRAKDRVLFARQLSTLINAGVPVVQGLRSVAEQTASKPLKVITNSIITDVEGGKSLSVALSKFPDTFNHIFVSLVAAGESSGTLDTALERIAVQQEKDADIVSKIRGALAYPIIVILVMVAVVGFMLVKVLPQVQILYAGLPGVSLPLITRVLLDVSHFFVHYWWVIVILVMIIGLGGFRWARHTPAGRSILDSAKLHLWPTNTLFKKVYMARFARTAGTLVSAGVPLIQVLQITGDAVDNVHIEEAIKRAAEKVKGGKALSDSLQGEPTFLPLVPSMLRIGEQSGSMEQMLDKTASYYEKEVDNAIKTISDTLEPVLMVLLGIVAFIIVAAVLLPIYGLAGKSFVQV